MKLLDLYCGGGGASMGYHMAGFEVTGVDIRPQPRYPFTFHRGDALTFPLEGYDVIHASPPCQRYSQGAAQAGTSHLHPDLIAPTRARLLGHRYIIENIPTARSHLHGPVMLCGEWFGLGVFRHRLFESNMALIGPPHPSHVGHIDGVTMHTVTGNTGGEGRGLIVDWRRAMDIGWMTGRELVESIPPAYTWFLGDQAVSLIGAAL